MPKTALTAKFNYLIPLDFDSFLPLSPPSSFLPLSKGFSTITEYKGIGGCIEGDSIPTCEGRFAANEDDKEYSNTRIQIHLFILDQTSPKSA